MSQEKLMKIANYLVFFHHTGNERSVIVHCIVGNYISHSLYSILLQSFAKVKPQFIKEVLLCFWCVLD